MFIHTFSLGLPSIHGMRWCALCREWSGSVVHVICVVQTHKTCYGWDVLLINSGGSLALSVHVVTCI